MADEEFDQKQSTIWLESTFCHRGLHLLYTQQLEIERFIVSWLWHNALRQLQIIHILALGLA